jgi:6-phosphogluconolactonase/glucosamine-6-phosphate isomerase/deaminase
VATGEGKAEVLVKILEEKDESYPATRVKGDVVWFLDDAARVKLKKE